MVTLRVEDFGTYKGEPVKKFVWQTSSGFQLSVISYGAIVQAIKVLYLYNISIHTTPTSQYQSIFTNNAIK